MVEWFKVADLDLAVDLSRLVQFLAQKKIPHRITEEGGRQVVWVADPNAIAPLNEFLDRLVSGDVDLLLESNQLSIDELADTRANTGSHRFILNIFRSPITFLLILLSALGFLVVELRLENLFEWMIFLQWQNGQFLSLEQTLANGEIWRLFTPAFLHFGIFHIVFNSLWMWDLGRRLEFIQGRKNYIGSIFFMAVAANLTQYLIYGGANFGGMSGVLYGLVGYIAVRQRFAPHPALNVPRGIIIFMLVWLLVCMSGVVDLFMQGGIANGAHVGGLVAGALLGLWVSFRGHSKSVTQ